MPDVNKPNSSRSLARTFHFWICLWLVCLTGCQTFDAKAPFPWEKEKDKPQPDKIMAVWTDA
ncbi:MAG: hypothetical protein ACKO0N_03515, partial [Planctomycetota bacterium]